MQQYRNNHGFTFIEVLAALVFAAVILPAAMKGISLAANAAATTIHQSEATELAQNLIAEISATATSAFTGSEGTFDEYPAYRWTAEIQDWTATDSGFGETATNLKGLEVRVFWNARNTEHFVSLTTLIGQQL